MNKEHLNISLTYYVDQEMGLIREDITSLTWESLGNVFQIKSLDTCMVMVWTHNKLCGGQAYDGTGNMAASVRRYSCLNLCKIPSCPVHHTGSC